MRGRKNLSKTLQYLGMIDRREKENKVVKLLFYSTIATSHKKIITTPHCLSASWKEILEMIFPANFRMNHYWDAVIQYHKIWSYTL